MSIVIFTGNPWVTVLCFGWPQPCITRHITHVDHVASGLEVPHPQPIAVGTTSHSVASQVRSKPGRGAGNLVWVLHSQNLVGALPIPDQRVKLWLRTVSCK